MIEVGDYVVLRNDSSWLASAGQTVWKVTRAEVDYILLLESEDGEVILTETTPRVRKLTDLELITYKLKGSL